MENDGKKKKISLVGSKSKIFAILFSFLFLCTIFVGQRANAETTPTPFLVAKYKDFSEYANYSTFDHPAENNTYIVIKAYSGEDFVSGYMYKNYSYDDTQYLLLYSNSTGTYAGKTVILETNSSTRTVEMDLLLEKDSVLFVGYAITASILEAYMIQIWNESIRIYIYYNGGTTFLGYANETLQKINESIWIKLIYSVDVVSPYQTTHSVLYLDGNIYTYNYTSKFSDIGTAGIQFAIARINWVHFANIGVENFAMYSKSLSAADLEKIHSPARIAFANIADAILAVMPMFFLVGLVGVLIQKVRHTKFGQ